MATEQTARAPRRLANSSGRSLLIRSTAVAIVDAAIVYLLIRFVVNEAWTVVTMLGGAALLVNWAYLSPRANASRWLTPGLVLMAVFVVYPVVYTGYVSLTNWQTGNVLTRAQVIENLEEREIRSEGPTETGPLSVYRAGDDLAFLVGSDDVDVFFGIPRPTGDATEPTPVPGVDPSTLDPDAPPPTIGEYERLTGLGLTAEASRLQDLELDVVDGEISLETLQTFRLSVTGPRFRYDDAEDVLFDLENGYVCPAAEGTFSCDAVPEAAVSPVARLAEDTTITCRNRICDDVPLFAIDPSLPGWREVVGFDNYQDLFTNERIRNPIARVFAWNVTFALLSVLLTFGLGLSLALTLRDETMRGRSIYRSIYILPYAIPAFLSILIWRGLLGTEFGKVNALLNTFGIPDVDWFGDQWAAMAAIVLVNTWLGFPYMFLICSGALTSIPEELLEAARVDGAGPWRQFRSVVLPLLLVSTAPLLIGAFAFNFNNFVLVYLLTNGGPPLSGYDVPVGSTDLLISFTFELAGSSGRGNQFGLSSAIIVVIFVILATTSASSFRLTKKLEDVYG